MPRRIRLYSTWLLATAESTVRRQPDELLHVVDVEVADAPVPYFSLALEPLECGQRLVQRHRAAPVQKIQVEMIRVQPAKARLAGRHGATSRRMLRQHLADQEDLAAPIAKRFGDELLGRASRVHLRGVDDGHAEVYRHLQRGDFVRAMTGALRHAPGADAKDRNRFAAGKRDRSQRRTICALRAHWRSSVAAMAHEAEHHEEEVDEIEVERSRPESAIESRFPEQSRPASTSCLGRQRCAAHSCSTVRPC